MTDEIRCPICAHRTPEDDWTVCRPCLGRIDDDLARIVELTTMAAQWTGARKGTQEPTSRPVVGSRPPLDVSALDAALGLGGGICDPATRDGLVQGGPVVLDTLESWVKLTREEAGLVPWGIATEGRSVTVASLVAFLRSWLAWIVERVDYPVDDLASEVKSLRWQLEVLDPDRDKPGPRIPCQGDHPDNDGRRCGYRLAVTMDRPADDVSCPRCGDTTTAGRILLSALNDPTMTVWAYPADITEALGIPSTTLRQWSTRGHVRRLGSRYDVGACFRRNLG
jgi:hypothetical protein